MARGKRPLTATQTALLKKVRESRLRLEAVDLEIQERIEELERTLRGDAEDETRAAIWNALDSGVPMSDLKRVMNIANHDTFKNRWILAYVPLEGNYEIEWTSPRRESVRLLRFMEIRVDILFDFDEQGDYVAVEGADDEPAQILLDKLDSGEYADEWKQMWTDLKEERQ